MFSCLKRSVECRCCGSRPTPLGSLSLIVDRVPYSYFNLRKYRKKLSRWVKENNAEEMGEGCPFPLIAPWLDLVQIGRCDGECIDSQQCSHQITIRKDRSIIALLLQYQVIEPQPSGKT